MTTYYNRHLNSLTRGSLGSTLCQKLRWLLCTIHLEQFRPKHSETKILLNITHEKSALHHIILRLLIYTEEGLKIESNRRIKLLE